MPPCTINGRPYHPLGRSVVSVCPDGSADEDVDTAMARGRLAHLQRLSVTECRGFVRGQIPGFTDVNDASLVIGVPPSVHGIGSNLFCAPVSARK